MSQDRNSPPESLDVDGLSETARNIFGVLEELINNSRTPAQAAVDLRDMIAFTKLTKSSITLAEWLQIEGLTKKKLAEKYPYLIDTEQIPLS